MRLRKYLTINKDKKFTEVSVIFDFSLSPTFMPELIFLYQFYLSRQLDKVQVPSNFNLFDQISYNRRYCYE